MALSVSIDLVSSSARVIYQISQQKVSDRVRETRPNGSWTHRSTPCTPGSDKNTYRPNQNPSRPNQNPKTVKIMMVEKKNERMKITVFVQLAQDGADAEAGCSAV